MVHGIVMPCDSCLEGGRNSGVIYICSFLSYYSKKMGLSLGLVPFYKGYST